jgi:hypothetical protein
MSGQRQVSAEQASVQRVTFEYAVVQVVPRVDRGEVMNAGVLVYSRPRDFLGAAMWLDRERLQALDPVADVDGIERALQAVADVCAATPGCGPAGREDLGRRFRWLTAPRSTVVQAGPVHTGLTADPAAELQRLLEVLVKPVVA